MAIWTCFKDRKMFGNAIFTSHWYISFISPAVPFSWDRQRWAWEVYVIYIFFFSFLAFYSCCCLWNAFIILCVFCFTQKKADNHPRNFKHSMRSVPHSSCINNLVLVDHWKTDDCICTCKLCNPEVKFLVLLCGEVRPVVPELFILSEIEVSLKSSKHSRKACVRICCEQVCMSTYCISIKCFSFSYFWNPITDDEDY